jgi:23S rRNA (guanosine2251-2'-O)-methyltransferase
MNTIIGRKPVLEAIISGEEVEQIFILYGQKGGIINAIRIASKKKRIKCSEVKKERFKSITSSSNTQGVVAIKSSYKFYSLEEIISTSKKSKYPLLVALDSIQDPHNVGAILRSAECAGTDGIIITKYNSSPINQTVVKTSAGATEHLKLAIVNNLSQSLHLLKENGFWIIGSSLEDSKNYTEVDYKIPIVLVAGNEEKGIRHLTSVNCDFMVQIPMKGEIQSLNVSVATGILLFEILRQRAE